MRGPRDFGLAVVLEYEDRGEKKLAHYAFEIAAKPDRDFEVKREKCRVESQEDPFVSHAYEVQEGKFVQVVPGVLAKLDRHRLALPIVSAAEPFTGLYDHLCSWRFYSLIPDRIRELQDPDPGLALKKDGSNLAAVIREIKQAEKGNGNRYQTVLELLSQIVPGMAGVEPWPQGNKLTLKFLQETKKEGKKSRWSFPALNMSDGTLRALGILIALNQIPIPPLVAIEEPEATIHPGALGVLMDAFNEGKTRSQILVTTHCPDLLDHSSVTDENLRLVEFREGETLLLPVGAVSKSAIKKRLATYGELMRENQLVPQEFPANWKPQKLFDFPSTPRKP
jgi:predicted ATPase